MKIRRTITLVMAILILGFISISPSTSKKNTVEAAVFANCQEVMETCSEIWSFQYHACRTTYSEAFCIAEFNSNSTGCMRTQGCKWCYDESGNAYPCQAN